MIGGVIDSTTGVSESSAIATVIEDVFYKLDFSLVGRSAGLNIERRLNDTVLNGGKRFRPILLVLFGNFMGLSLEELAPYARAVELAHAATLAHDDVIDEAHERRNNKTLNRVASNAHAVLGGDFLLARVIAEIARLGKVEIIQEMAEVLEQLVSGEWLQLEARGIVAVDHAHLETVAKRKTASLISWCYTTPARLRGLDAQTVELCRELGYTVGLAFQQIDDLLDFEQNSGKAFAKDLRERQVNFVACELLRQNPELEGSLAACLGTNGPWPWTDRQLDAAIESVREIARGNVGHAEALLDSICERVRDAGVSICEDSHGGLRESLAAMIERTR